MTRTTGLRAASAAILALAAVPASAAPEKAAVFDFQYSTLSPVPTDAADRARLARSSDELRGLLREKGLFSIVSTDPVKAEVAGSADLRNCGGCAETFARQLGAQVAITGVVQKVSNLILNLTVYVKHLDGGAPEKAYGVSLRGDTDESFDRAVKFLVADKMAGSP